MSFGGTPLSDRLGFELGDLQHTQDSTSNISKSCQVSRLPALLGGKNRFCFFCLQQTHDHCVWFLHFFPKISSWHKIQVMALLRQAVRSVAQAGCFQTSAWWVFFFHAVNLLSSQFIFGRSLPCVQQHQAMCCFNHNRFFGFNIFASNTDQKYNCCLLTVQRSDAILVGLFIVPIRVCVIKVACSMFLCNYRLYANMQCVITGWTTYIF